MNGQSDSFQIIPAPFPELCFPDDVGIHYVHATRKGPNQRSNNGGARADYFKNPWHIPHKPSAQQGKSTNEGNTDFISNDAMVAPCPHDNGKEQSHRNSGSNQCSITLICKDKLVPAYTDCTKP